MLQNNELYDLIPQSAPFIMIDSLVFSDEHQTITRFTVKEDHLLCRNGFFKEPGIIENIAQTAALHAGIEAQKNNSPKKTGYIGSVKNLWIRFLPKIGQTLETQIRVNTLIGNITVIDGQVSYIGKVVATCEMTIIEFQDNQKI